MPIAPIETANQLSSSRGYIPSIVEEYSELETKFIKLEGVEDFNNIKMEIPEEYC